MCKNLIDIKNKLLCNAVQEIIKECGCKEIKVLEIRNRI